MRRERMLVCCLGVMAVWSARRWHRNRKGPPGVLRLLPLAEPGLSIPTRAMTVDHQRLYAAPQTNRELRA